MTKLASKRGIQVQNKKENGGKKGKQKQTEQAYNEQNLNALLI